VGRPMRRTSISTGLGMADTAAMPLSRRRKITTRVANTHNRCRSRRCITKVLRVGAGEQKRVPGPERLLVLRQQREQIPDCIRGRTDPVLIDVPLRPLRFGGHGIVRNRPPRAPAEFRSTRRIDDSECVAAHVAATGLTAAHSGTAPARLPPRAQMSWR